MIFNHQCTKKHFCIYFKKPQNYNSSYFVTRKYRDIFKSFIGEKYLGILQKWSHCQANVSKTTNIYEINVVGTILNTFLWCFVFYIVDNIVTIQKQIGRILLGGQRKSDLSATAALCKFDGFCIEFYTYITNSSYVLA